MEGKERRLIAIGLLAIDFFLVGAFQSPPARSDHASSFGLRSPWSIPPRSTVWTTFLPPSDFLFGTRLYAKLWDRLEIEEDPEPMWYLLNCVAGNEIDLLRQCRVKCADMPDAVKFVVPTMKKTRSHGPNRMVTETKVKYLGYVFAKIRLCQEVYEAIQGLDLCRSWMGTVNHKGYKKLPPAPVALNELEIEKFGLEGIDDHEEEDRNADQEVDDSGVIVDEADEDEDKPSFEEEAIKVYLGFKVEDMVKVTASGKFNNEDGIVRRLKEGKLLVRFYTYGTLYEEWMDPTDVRKLSNIEILKGLSGPSQPITQRDFDGPSSSSLEPGRRGDSDIRRTFTGGTGGANTRERRQDRTANRFSQSNRDGDFFGRTEQERNREEKNWNWYQDKQRQERGNVVASEGINNQWKIQAGSKQNNDGRSGGGDDWALGDVDSQWGRKSQRPQRKDGQQQRQQRNTQDIRRAEAAIDGADDWSSFVTSSTAADGSSKTAASASSRDGGAGAGSNDFFDSLMSDLSKDLGSGGASSSSSSSWGSNASPQPATSQDKVDEDEFFASLMSDLTEVTSSDQISEQSDNRHSSSTRQKASSSPPRREEARSTSTGTVNDNTNDADDFFASLEAELGDAYEDVSSSPTVGEGWGGNEDDGSDDFFAKLEAELAVDVNNDNALLSSTNAAGAIKSRKQPQEKQPATTTTRKPRSAAPASSDVRAAAKATITTTTPPPPSDLQTLTVPILKDMLKDRGLKVTGKKAELIERLRVGS